MKHSFSAERICEAKKKLPDHLSKIDFRLLDVIAQLKTDGTTRENISQNEIAKHLSISLLQFTNDGGVRAEVYMKRVSSEGIESLRATGAVVEFIDQHFKRVTCVIPLDRIEGLGKDENVTGIYGTTKPITEIGTYTTAGDGILNASTARSTFGTNGSNIKVGIISDGANHCANAIGSGDLPSNFQVVSDLYQGDEGTAMAEIVYDIAPGASLAFADYGDSESRFADRITALINAGCTVIVDDVLYPDEPFFEDGTIALAVENATANGVTYISSAGNAGNKTWYGQSADANSNTWMEFSGSDETNAITIQPGESFVAILQWANEWGLSNDDYDLYLFSGPDPSSQVLAFSADRQGGTGNPHELIGWYNSGQNPTTVYLRVKLYAVQTPRVIKLLGFYASSNFNYVTDGGVSAHAAASSCLSVGAIHPEDPQTIAGYSSHGPSRIYTYNGNGNPISYTERSTPTICGIAHVQTYVGMSGLWNGQQNYIFNGTSAAAPHIAGITALLLSKQGSADWQQVKQQLILTATKVSGMGGQNFTNRYGYGRADAYEGIRTLYVPQGHSTIETAASVATSGQTIIVSSGSYAVNSNVTIASGVTLTIGSGCTLNFSGNSKLHVGGKLLVHGASGSVTTFTSSGSQWFGIEFWYGSSGSELDRAVIENAQHGLSLYSTSPYISNCTIRNDSIGVYASGTYSTIIWTILDNNTYGFKLTSDADPTISHSVLRYNNFAVWGDATSVPIMGGISGSNSFNYSGYYDVYTTYGGTINAQSNWWYPWSPSFYGNVDYSYYLGSDPNTWAGRLANLPNRPILPPTLAKMGGIASDSPGMKELDQAHQLLLNGNQEQALSAFQSVASRYPDAFAGERALAFADHILEKSGRDAKQNLTTTIAQRPNSKVGVAAKSLLTGHLVKAGSYKDALENAVSLMGQSDVMIAKQALYDAGNITWYRLGDKVKATEYFRKLIAMYPQDPLSTSAQATLGVWVGKDLSNQKESPQDGNDAETGLFLKNYPNPFNPSTHIQFKLPESGRAVLRIFNALGQVAATLFEGETEAGKTYEVLFDASNLPSGVYFSRLEYHGDQIVRKLILMK